ncbi:MAG: FAD-dependent oxidoreductase, partial [Thermomicrobiales bacterium]
MNTHCDLLVIGGGTAGLVGAKTAAGFNAHVVLVERDRPGGDCLWTGCIPSKSLIAAASAAAHIRQSSSLGVHAGEIKIDFDEVMGHVHDAIRTIEPTDSFNSLRAAGVHVIAGDVIFEGSDTVSIGKEQVRFRQALVATGATPLVPDIPGL